MTKGIRIDSGGGDVGLTAGGDIVAGNKITVQFLVKQLRPETALPYKFLSYYEIADRDIFFGRQDTVDRLMVTIRDSRLVLINGQAGAGKTSLINAGLLPRLTDDNYTYIRFREYSDPLEQFAKYFGAFGYPDSAPRAKQTDFVRFLLRARADSPNLILILDQFERFFLGVSDENRELFVREIARCLKEEALKDLRVLIAVREDFFGRLVSEFETQIPNFLRENRYINLPPLHVREARTAILRPLKDVAKVGYDAAFVDKILIPQLVKESPGENVIEPSHLQIVCNRLYVEANRRQSQAQDDGGVVVINQALYNDLGGARGILEGYLDQVVDRVANGNADKVKTVRSILKLMIQSGKARKFVSLEDLKRNLLDVKE